MLKFLSLAKWWYEFWYPLWDFNFVDLRWRLLNSVLLWPSYGIGQAIIFSSCGFFFLSFFFSSPILSRRTVPYFHTWCGLSANLECRSENVLHAAHGKYRTQKIAKNSLSAHHRTTLSGCIFASKACIDNRKNVNQQYLLQLYLHNMANFGPLTADIGLPVWGTAAHFNGFRALPSLLQRRRSPEANQTLHDVWPSPGLVVTIYTFSAALAPLQHFINIYVPSKLTDRMVQITFL